MDYRMNELSLTLPGDAWADESVNVIFVIAPDKSRVAIVVNRSAPVDEDKLAAKVDEDIKNESRRLRGFELLRRGTFTAGGITGVALRFRWVHDDGPLHHAMAYLPLGDRLLLFTITAKASQAGACDELLSAVTETIKPR